LCVCVCGEMFHDMKHEKDRCYYYLLFFPVAVVFCKKEEGEGGEGRGYYIYIYVLSGFLGRSTWGHTTHGSFHNFWFILYCKFFVEIRNFTDEFR